MLLHFKNENLGRAVAMRGHRHEIPIQLGHQWPRLARRLCRNRANRSEMAGVDLLLQVDEPLAAGHVNPMTHRVINHIVDTGCDGERLSHAARIRIENSSVRPGTRRETMMRLIEGHRHVNTTSRDWPSGHGSALFPVNDRNLILFRRIKK
jgi:hypothetical protein